MFASDKLIKRRPSATEQDSVRARQKMIGKGKDIHLLETAQTLWMNNEQFRQEYARASRFAYGDQWGDPIEVDGVVMTQKKYLEMQGNVVIQTNQIKNKIDTIVGVLVKEKNEPVCYARDPQEQQYGEVLTEALKANCNKNKMEDLYIKWMKDVCLGGLAASYESYDAVTSPSGRLDSWTKYVDPNMLFFDSEMSDPRFWDCSLIGQFFDLTFGDLCARFGRGDVDNNKLRELYPNATHYFLTAASIDNMDKAKERANSFLLPADPTRCRVFEIWRKETKARIRLHDYQKGEEEIIDADDKAYRDAIRRENIARRAAGRAAGWNEADIPYITGDGFGRDKEEKDGSFIDEYWYCRFLAPDGTILWEGESPLADRSHPFTLLATPLIEGKVVGYMHDAIDHNIAMNRAIILHDWLVRAQAKGVTVVPKSIVPSDMSLQEFANSWTKIDDIVFIDVKPGQEKLMPQVFHSSAQTFDVANLINTYNKLMENSTAVSGAIQGKTPYSGTSGSLYAQMAANASTPIAALLSQFHSFLESIHTKKLKNIAENYDIRMLQAIAGNIPSLIDNANLNLHKVADIEYDLSIIESASTPTHRAIVRDDLKQFLVAGFISFEEFLEFSDEPYAKEMLQKRQARAAEMQAMQNEEEAGMIEGGSPAPSGSVRIGPPPAQPGDLDTQGI